MSSKEYHEEYYQANKEKFKEYQKENKEKIKERSKEYYQSNKEKILERDKEYYQSNKEKICSKILKYQNDRYKTDPLFRLRKNIRNRIKMAIKSQSTSKASSSFKLLGCTAKEAYDYIESLFLEGMTWDNYGDWEIDHIRPCSSFDLTQESEQLLCFNYKNLQPLWWEDNSSKSDKWEK